MVMLTGGEKYNTKQIIVKINEIYPGIKDIVEKEGHIGGASLNKLYNVTLEIFIQLSTLTLNIINSSKILSEIFTSLQEIHYYKDVNSNNKQTLIQVSKRIPELQDELINLVESDTSNRDAVLRQIMDELGIIDPNAKKKRSLW